MLSFCHAPQRVSQIVTTCCVLRNICRRNGLVFLNDFDPVNEQFSVKDRRVDSRGGRGGPDLPKNMHWGGPKSKGPPQ